MNYKSIILMATISLFAMSNVTAQEDTRDQLKSYSYVEAQGGIQWTAPYGKWADLITPTAAVSVGHFFNPTIGARLHVNGWQSKLGLENYDLQPLFFSASSLTKRDAHRWCGIKLWLEQRSTESSCQRGWRQPNMEGQSFKS